MKENIRSALPASDQRWRMNRVGILNFWYYDEEEFELEDGRLILRGANGSGKSVTMQSFLPLVLDGDKRPSRLDPFGSRDRRIEYYLLGETDSGKSDVTGYLWMEFVHPAKEIFKTIGIGLRARRGAAQVQFWGFVLEDGRRIGKNFWLYDRNHWLEHNVRVPLSRRELEEKVGAGGQVVHDQTSYRDLVNKQLFGFAEADAFQDLLQLMIQLRSPKLSKDFKPSAIYDILHKALPPLHEDELRPLSEVLEDMDQIADGLDEVRLHRKEMNKLQDSYDRYNKYMIYVKSIELLNKKAEYEKTRNLTSEAEQSLREAEDEKWQFQEEMNRVEARLQEMAAEIEVLENHEAIGKQRELEAATAALGDVEKHLQLAQERMVKHQARTANLERTISETEHKYEELNREQRAGLDDLETMAQEAEFAEHPVYHRYWDRGLPEDDGWREPWRRDLRNHRERLERALDCAQKEREAAGLVRELELELGESRKERDNAERERSLGERRLEQSKEELREEIVMWRNGLQALDFGDDRIRLVFKAISEFGQENRAYEPVRAPVMEAFNEQREALATERLKMIQHREVLEQEKKRLQDEKNAWKQSREPEPGRNEARMRARLESQGGSGAPLFAVCDFQPHVDEAAKARIEEALERAGLLDAWISADGRIGAVADGREEFWIVPQPHEIGYTLADVLVPVPSEESGLQAEQVDAVLRTFLWDESGNVADYDSICGVISSRGHFRLGPLVGASRTKERAEYIGKETRKRTRMLEIERLQREIDQLLERLSALDHSLEQLKEREQQLRAESGLFPNGLKLQQDLQALLEAAFRLEAAMKQEQRILERYKLKSTEWRELQRQLVELTASWTRLKREKDLREAIVICRDYEGVLGELHSAWRRSREAAEALVRYREELESVLTALEEEEEQREEMEERRRVLRAQAGMLRSIIEELGLAEVTKRIESIRAERKQAAERHKAVSSDLDEVKQKAAALQERLRIYNGELAERQKGLELASGEWHREAGRALVADWRETYSPEMDLQQALNLAKEMRQRYESLFANRNTETITSHLLEHYNAVRIVLTDYVLETIVEEGTGRILIQSMRDRSHPQPPQVLLEELERSEEEQSLLLSEKDRELYEEIILRSVGKSIRQRIHRAENWVKQMNRLMGERNTSSGLQLKLEWDPKPALSEQQMDTATLVELLKRDAHRLREDEIDLMINHFRSQISYAKQNAQEEQESLRKHLFEVLDYRNWFQFELRYRKGDQAGYRPLTDSRFNVLSGGEKAMAMYIPLFAATWSRYSDARSEAPRLISLDEAFAGVDEENMRDMFKLLTDMGFDYMMTSQVLWGCYDTVPKLAIYEIYRPKDVDFVTLFRYRWNGKIKEYVQDGVNA
ncbi:TIGR02680 family protein [Paenibacillus sp. 32O-W]|uniref:TIGR02680 family protein n=1 Tax=Paenibacillus sp. 32O-W TaxID=1695218 RepID=UPI0011A03B95|nr:TIGR02680 family protein [Paenibacillus sp. 32O-W]